MKNSASFLLPLVFLSVICSCTDEPTSVAPGEIWGYVKVLDLDHLPWADNSGITVSLDGTSYTATTDADGKWVLADVPPGAYILNFEKPGITPTRLINTQFAGNGVLYIPTFNLYELPAFTITDLTLSPNSVQTQFDVVGHITENVASQHTRIVQFIYSTDPNSNFEPISSSIVGSAITNYQTGGTEIRGFIDYEMLAGKGIASGTTVYFKAYPAAAAHVYAWYPELQKEIYTSVTSAGSSVQSVVMP